MACDGSSTPREDVPWRVKHRKGGRSIWGGREFPRSYVFNRYGDVVAECPWGPDADFIAALVNEREGAKADA